MRGANYSDAFVQERHKSWEISLDLFTKQVNVLFIDLYVVITIPHRQTLKAKHTFIAQIRNNPIFEYPYVCSQMYTAVINFAAMFARRCLH